MEQSTAKDIEPVGTPEHVITTDNFTENDIRLFGAIKDRLSCGCDRTLWRLICDLDTKTYTIKCINCGNCLTLRQLYDIEFKTRIPVDTDPIVKLKLVAQIGLKMVEIHSLLRDIQTLLAKEVEKL